MAGVRGYLSGLTEESLSAQTEPVEGPGWPPESARFPVRECLLTSSAGVEHRRYAERTWTPWNPRGAEESRRNRVGPGESPMSDRHPLGRMLRT